MRGQCLTAFTAPRYSAGRSETDPRMRLSSNPYLILAATTLIWAGNAVASRLAAGHVSPMLLTTLRWAATIVLAAWMAGAAFRHEWPAIKANAGWLIVMGVIGFTGFNALFYVAGQYTTAVNLGIIQGAIPIMVLVGSFLAYRTRITTLQMVGIVVTLAGIFAWALSTLSVIDPITHAIVNSGLGEWGVLALLILLLMTVGMFLDGISIFLIFVPLLMPIANAYGWDPVWFGVILTLKVALGQFTPPLAVNLMVSCRIARVPMESTVPWVVWLLGAMFLVLVAVLVFPQLALWLPHKLGY